MIRTRQYRPPWLADHVVFFGYRWLTWLVAVGAALWQGVLIQSGWLLLVTTVVNIVALIAAQPYVRLARRMPAIMSLDIMFMVLVLLGGGGWHGPFLLYATSSLVLPGLLFGWRGGVMAGLAFVTLDQAGRWASGTPPAELLNEEQWNGLLALLATMAIPPAFGVLFALIIDTLRQRVQAHWRRSQRRNAPFPGSAFSAGTRAGLVDRRAPIAGAGQHESGARTSMLPLRTTTVRAAEQSVEDLRQVLFAPFPTNDMDLPASLDTLAARFSQQTGTAAHVTLLGRTRLVHRAQRGVLVRLTQEALLNVHQHAHAESITLTLRYDATSVALLIQDDGVGLLDGTYERPGLHALRAMRYRLIELGGRLDVFETEGSGVAVRATMPLDS